MGGPDWARSQRPSIFCFFLSNLSQTDKTGEKIQIMERCNFREIWKEIGGSEIHPQAFYLTSRKAHVNFIKGTCDEMPLLPGG
jgi:hypothetical protein